MADAAYGRDTVAVTPTHPSPERDGESEDDGLTQQRLEAYLRLGSAVLWEADTDGEVRYVSENIGNVLGVPQAVSVAAGELWARRIHPADRDDVEEGRARAFGAGSQYTIVYRMMSADGAEIWVRESAMPTGARTPAFRGLLEDITTLRHAERRLSIKDRTAEILANAGSVGEAGSACLEMVCEALRWDWGAVWMVDDADDVLRCIAAYGRAGTDLGPFERDSIERSFERGVGLPGRVWQRGEPTWIPALDADTNFPRARTALALGLRSAYGFPIVLGSQVLGVLEFFTLQHKERDPELVQLMTNLGRQIGQFSERKVVEEELRISEDRYRSLAEALPAMVSVLTPGGELAYVNRRWMDYTGLELPELQEGWPEQVMHPEDLERVREAWEASRRGGTPLEVDYRIRRADGRHRWHFLRAVPLRAGSGRIVRWLGTTTDIDDRKHAEEAQEFLAAGTALLASSLNYEATLRSLAGLVVPRMADIAAIDVFEPDGSSRRIASRAIDETKQLLLDETHVRDWPVASEHAERVSDVLAAGRSIFFPDVTLWRDRLGGQPGAFEAGQFGAKSLMLVPLRARNRTIGVLSLVSAESNRRYSPGDLEVAEELGRRAGIAVDNARLYQEARRSADELCRANAAKDEFLGLVSHELRTPITTIYGNAQVLRHRAEHLDEATRDLALADVEHEADRLHRIIDNMLVLARADSQRNLQTEPVLLQHAIARVVDAHQVRHPGRHITTQCAADLPPVAAEPTYLEQVLTNLLNNSEKYSGPSSPIVVQAAREGGDVAIRVLDEGKGIDPSEADMIFTAFFRSARTAGGATGAGIGLAVCKRLVEAQGGRIWARPREDGPGAEVGFALNLESEADS